ncbi:MAG TPA: glycosyltransferase family 39 protein [Candidatus Omnitrophota bacterium]|nr:glycosyltransferase family 39 protein [Candidatus Omnitrophota bacterium]
MLFKRITVFVSIFLLAFSIRFFFMSRGGFNTEATQIISAAQKTAGTGILREVQTGSGPMAVMFGLFFMKIFSFFGAQDPSIGANFMSVLAGSFTVIAFFAFLEKLLSFKKAVLSSLILCFFGPHIEISTFANGIVLSMLMYLGSMICMIEFREKALKPYLFFSGILAGLAVSARMVDLVILLPVSFLFFYSRPFEKRSLGLFAAFLFLFALTVEIYYFSYIFEKGGRFFISGLDYLKNIHFDPKSLLDLAYILMPEGLILACAGISYMLLKKHIMQFIFLILWFVVMQYVYGNQEGARYLVVSCLPLIAASGDFLGGFKGKMFYVSCLLAGIIGLGSFLRSAGQLNLKSKYILETNTIFQRLQEKKGIL